jgi:hypothetical protein
MVKRVRITVSVILSIAAEKLATQYDANVAMGRMQVCFASLEPRIAVTDEVSLLRYLAYNPAFVQYRTVVALECRNQNNAATMNSHIHTIGKLITTNLAEQLLPFA